MRDRFEVLMKQGLGEMSVSLSDRQTDQFYRYFELLTEWNKVMNLTAITELDQVVTKHFVDSLSLVRLIPESQLEGVSVLDLGTGAGFPGIPLKIAFPHMKVTLLDSLNKRIKFLGEVIEQLGLEGTKAVHGRAEDLGKTASYREQYDLCVSRAVANLSTLAEYCLPFVKTGGYFVAYKSGEAKKEIEEAENALRILGGRAEESVDFCLPDSDMYRILVKIKKEKKTPGKYPRKAGLPGKEPLK